MIRVEHEHYFAMPVEAGFAFITDMTNWPRYRPGFIRIEFGSRWSAAGDEAGRAGPPNDKRFASKEPRNRRHAIPPPQAGAQFRGSTWVDA